MPTASSLLPSARTFPVATPDLSERGQRMLARLRFEVFHPALVEMPAAAARFLDAILRPSERPFWLSYLGPSGVGKTLLCRQICALAARPGWWKIRTRDGHRGPWIAHIQPALDLQDWRAPSDFAKADLVYVEDIGSGVGLDRGAGSVLRGRIAELLQLRAGKWTLLDANLYRADIASQLDPRIASRLRRDGSVLIEIPATVPDYWGGKR